MAAYGEFVEHSDIGNVYIDTLTTQGRWAGGPIGYWFGTGPDPWDTPTVKDSWQESEKAAFRSALAQFSGVCNVTFKEDASCEGSNLGFWLWGPNNAGFASMPREGITTCAAVITAGSAENPMVQGSQCYLTIVHEMGHLMGLTHPQDGAPGFAGTTFDQRINSVMSYSAGWQQAAAAGYAYGDAGTLMAFDVKALQVLYGANMTTRTGSDVYQLPGQNAIGTFWSCIWDAGGADTISNAGSDLACTINLTAATLQGPDAGGAVSRASGIVGGYTIANGVTIENAVGGNGNDLLTGNDSANKLSGGVGNDSLRGGAGNDTLDGGAGIDTADYGDSRSNLTINLSRTTAQRTGDAGSDKLVSIENLVGGLGNDSLTGNSAANSLWGGAGNDLLQGGRGNDSLDGGLGADVLTGGSGNDRFAFDTSFAQGVDRIADFHAGDDRVVLDDALFTALQGGQLPVSAFQAAPHSAATTAQVHIVFNTSNGALLYDADGTGGVDAVQFATVALAGLSGVVTAADFLVE